MTWNGSGTYSRGYASWTNDANSGLPISSTKFDLEDSDFQGGIQNCLTIDGQNKPNATLSWAQTLLLTKAADATVFSVGRTGGTNNPVLSWAVADATGITQTLTFGSYNLTLPSGRSGFSFSNSAFTFGNATDAQTFSFNGAGLTSAAQVATVPALTTNGVTNGISALRFQSNGTTTGFIGTDSNAQTLVTGSSVNDLVIRGANTNIWLTPSFTGASIAAGLTSAGVWEISDNAASNSLWAAGYLDCPQNVQNGAYGLLLSDRGKSIYHGSASPHTYTIPANASVAFPAGTTIVVINEVGGGALTIAITTDTLVWAANGSTGSRTLAANGICTLYKMTSTSWLISGTGLT